MKASIEPRFVRKRLDRYGPNRGAANFYRAGVDDHHVIGGVPLDTVESAVTAAVRLGYKIAESQVNRASRLATRVRDAGDRATGGGTDAKRSDRRALDATEQLIFKTLMAGVGLLEGAAADRRNPLRRMASAQFQLLGALLGLLPTEPARSDPRSSTGDVFLADPDTPTRPTTAARASRRRAGSPRVKHGAAADGRRPVRVIDLELSPDAPAGSFDVVFYGGPSGSSTFRAEVESRAGGTVAMVTVTTSAETPTGVYKAAICDADGLQLGYIQLAV